MGGSHTYINDYAPSIEPTSDLSSNIALSTNTKPAEFPLFLEGQDATRAAYAVFLLNKVFFIYMLSSDQYCSLTQSQYPLMFSYYLQDS